MAGARDQEDGGWKWIEEQGKSRGGGRGPGPESVRELEDLVAEEIQDSDPASESGRRVRDVESEAGEVGLVAAPSGCPWH